MKKSSWLSFIGKTVVFLLCVFVVDIIIGKVFDSFENYIYARNPKSMKSDYMVKSLQSDIIVLGASIASHHYIPTIIEDSLNMSVYNCGFDGMSFISQNSLLNLMLDRYKPKVIVWEIGEISLEVEKETEQLNCLYPYYDTNPQVRETVNATDVFQRCRMMSKTYRHNSSILNDVKNLLFLNPVVNKIDLKGYSPLDTTGYLFPSKIRKKYENTLDDNKLNLLEKTITRCKNINVNLVFSSSPRFIENYDEIKSSKSNRAIIGIADKYEIPIIDFYEIYSNDSTLFKDNAHMNDNGTRMYMGVFIPALKKVLN